jgi:translocation and assembly module TamB
MSEPEESTLPVPPEPSNPPRPPGRLRLLLLLGACLTILPVAATVGLYFWASSAESELLIRKRLVAWLEQATGGRVEIASFHWDLLNLEADAGGLVIHGLEAPGEAPYARIEHLRVRISVLGFWSPRVLLREADVSRPALHLIVYADGSTN